MTGEGQNTLVYDGEGRATSSSGSAGSGTYGYDGKGLRINKVSGGAATVYVFAGPKVIAEYASGAAPSSPTREYVYSGGRLLAKIESSATKYYHQDHLSNRIVTDSAGAVVEQMGHYPFGEAWYNASGDKLIFTSYERDSESGNDYAIARLDVSRLGRFLSPDSLDGTIANPQSFNRFAYTRNDPVNLTDPTGMFVAPQLYALMHEMHAAMIGALWNSSEFELMELQRIGTNYRFAVPTWYHGDVDLDSLMASWQTGDGGVEFLGSSPIYGGVPPTQQAGVPPADIFRAMMHIAQPPPPPAPPSPKGTCVYMNASGTAADPGGIDPNSTAAECAATNGPGGMFIEGLQMTAGLRVTEDPDTGIANILLSQESCAGLVYGAASASAVLGGAGAAAGKVGAKPVGWLLGVIAAGNAALGAKTNYELCGKGGNRKATYW